MQKQIGENFHVTKYKKHFHQIRVKMTCLTTITDGCNITQAFENHKTAFKFHKRTSGFRSRTGKSLAVNSETQQTQKAKHKASRFLSILFSFSFSTPLPKEKQIKEWGETAALSKGIAKC